MYVSNKTIEKEKGIKCYLYKNWAKNDLRKY